VARDEPKHRRRLGRHGSESQQYQHDASVLVHLFNRGCAAALRRDSRADGDMDASRGWNPRAGDARQGDSRTVWERPHILGSDPHRDGDRREVGTRRHGLALHPPTAIRTCFISSPVVWLAAAARCERSARFGIITAPRETRCCALRAIVWSRVRWTCCAAFSRRLAAIWKRRRSQASS
jgi:hypothetical protein